MCTVHCCTTSIWETEERASRAYLQGAGLGLDGQQPGQDCGHSTAEGQGAFSPLWVAVPHQVHSQEGRNEGSNAGAGVAEAQAKGAHLRWVHLQPGKRSHSGHTEATDWSYQGHTL